VKARLLLALLALCAQSMAATPAKARPRVPLQWLIRFDPSAVKTHNPKSDVRDSLHARMGAMRLKRLDAITTDLVQFSAGADEEALAALYRQDASVTLVEPNGVMKAFGPNDSFYNGSFGGVNYEPWYDQIRATQAFDAWNAGQITLKDTITVALLDTGADQHQELSQGQLLAVTNFSDDSGNADGEGHGTFIAGIIGAGTNNSQGIAGVFFDTPLIRILPIKVLDSSGSGSDASVSQGIIYAQDQGARILNMSLGESAASDTVRAAVDYAIQGGAFVVAAAGNDFGGAVSFPAAFPDVFAVGAVDGSDQITPYSNFGRLDLSAPGGLSNGGYAPCPCVATPSGNLGAIWSLCNNAGGPTGLGQCPTNTPGSPWTDGSGGYALYHSGAGTSFATPMVAATAALLLSQDSSRNAQSLYQILSQSADPTAYGSGYNPKTGWGRLDVYRALTYVGGPSPTQGAGKIKVYNWPNPFNPDKEGITNITFYLDQPATTVVQVRDLAGDLVFEDRIDVSQTFPGMNIVAWNGRNGNGRTASNGTYLLTVTANSIFGNNRILVLR
jgi:hypothetical protein